MNRQRLPLLLLVLCASASTVWATQSKPKPAPEAPPEPTPPAEAPPQLKWQSGPAKISLGHNLTLDLPETDDFLDTAQGAKLLAKMGRLHNESLCGLVISKNEQHQWLVVIDYDEAGYVKDDEKIDAADLLKSLRESQEEANKERVAQGFSALTLDGWSEPPHYDRGRHHLIWGLKVTGKSTSINYNTRILGRRGFVSLNLVTAPEAVATDKSEAEKLLAATTFNKGARYEDFVSKTDKVAEYGLTGLIGLGVGAAALKLVKIGLLAKFSKVILGVLIAGKKLVVLLFVGIAGFVKRLFGGGPKSEPTRPIPPSMISSTGEPKSPEKSDDEQQGHG
jgi:uncharacterized membrane-anchored protein